MSLFWIFCTRREFVSFGQSDLVCCSNKHDENIRFVFSGFINLKNESKNYCYIHVILQRVMMIKVFMNAVKRV